MDPHCMAYLEGIFFANMGVGVVRIVFTRKSQIFTGNPLLSPRFCRADLG